MPASVSRPAAHSWPVPYRGLIDAPNRLRYRGCQQTPETTKVTTMAVIKVTDIAYARLRAPDLDLQAEFNENFGLVKSERTNNAIYYRATDPVHHIHITEKG